MPAGRCPGTTRAGEPCQRQTLDGAWCGSCVPQAAPTRPSRAVVERFAGSLAQPERPTLRLVSGLPSFDTAIETLADVASINADHLIVGGMMVASHEALAPGPPLELPSRLTRDVDLGFQVTSLEAAELGEALAPFGYRRTAGNRFETDTGRSIDVLIPATSGRARHNRPVAGMMLDESPGLAYALREGVLEAKLDARLSDGTTVAAEPLRLPTLRAALVLKTLAMRVRAEQRDAEDVCRCLMLLERSWDGRRLDDHSEARDAADVLRRQFSTRKAPQLGAIRDRKRVAAFVRELTGAG